MFPLWMKKCSIIPEDSGRRLVWEDSWPGGKGSYDIKGVKADLINEDWEPTLYLPGNVDDEGLWGNIK